MCDRVLRTACLFALMVVLLSPGWLEAAQERTQGPTEWRWQNIERIVTIGAVEGRFDRVVELLSLAGLVDGNLRWTGDGTHLVSLGDLAGAGEESDDDVLSLFMRLQDEAREAGGRVHLILGEREVMRMARALESSAYRPGGLYGNWLLGQPVLIVINDTVFVHSGLSEVIHGAGIETLNHDAATDLLAYLSLWRRLRKAGFLPAQSVAEAGPAAALRALRHAKGPTPAADDLERLTALSETMALSPGGPLWYAGTTACHPLTEWDVTGNALKALGANRVILGHSRAAAHGRVSTRIEGRVIAMDTGSESALILQDGEAQVLARGQGVPAQPQPDPWHAGAQPSDMDLDELEDFLLRAPVTAIEPVGVGVTRPSRVTLEANGVRLRALFKTFATEIPSRSGTRLSHIINRSDRYHYEVAAYRLDRLLGFDLVPVTVLREINGAHGSLAFWIEGLISALEINQQGIEYAGGCSRNQQYALMSVFDTLIYNDDRTQQNTVFTRGDWRLRLIDHSRAFRTHRRRFPAYVDEPEWPVPVLSTELVRRLRALDYSTLNEALGTLLTGEQIRAILSRRDLILETWTSE